MTTRRRAVTGSEMDASPSEYGGNRGRPNRGRPADEVHVAGDAAAQRSAIVRSDSTNPGTRRRRS